MTLRVTKNIDNKKKMFHTPNKQRECAPLHHSHRVIRRPFAQARFLRKQLCTTSAQPSQVFRSCAPDTPATDYKTTDLLCTLVISS